MEKRDNFQLVCKVQCCTAYKPKTACLCLFNIIHVYIFLYGVCFPIGEFCERLLLVHSTQSEREGKQCGLPGKTIKGQLRLNVDVAENFIIAHWIIACHFQCTPSGGASHQRENDEAWNNDGGIPAHGRTRQLLPYGHCFTSADHQGHGFLPGWDGETREGPVISWNMNVQPMSHYPLSSRHF